MDIVTNSFCAGGTVLGNGTWLNVGGNQAVKQGGDPADSQKGGGVYDDPDGGKSCVAFSYSSVRPRGLTVVSRGQCAVRAEINFHADGTLTCRMR